MDFNERAYVSVSCLLFVLRLISAYEMQLNSIRAVVKSGFHLHAIVFQECLYIQLVRESDTTMQAYISDMKLCMCKKKMQTVCC